MSRNPQKHGQLVAVSITSPSWRAKLGKLDTLNIAEIRTEATEAIGRTKQVEWAVLGLDISMNDDTQKGFDVGWQIQFYGFARVNDRLGFSKCLRRSFRRSTLVIRPVVVKACDGTAQAFSYALKTESVRRVAYWGYGTARNGEPRNCWRTRKVSLKAREDVELRLFLHRLGLSQRLLLFKVSVVPTQPGFQLTQKKLE